MTTEYLLNLEAREGGTVNRRAFLRTMAAGTVAMSWPQQLSLHAAEMRKREMSCILLWMNGGPSQFDTFDPKPDHVHGNGVPVIRTAVPGIQIAASWPKTAAVMKDAAIIRSMTSAEGDHQRGVIHLLTSYRLDPLIKYPRLETIVAKEIGDPMGDLPNFVLVGGGGGDEGFLGVKHAPFVVNGAGGVPANIHPGGGMTPQRLDKRVELMKKLERDYAASGHQALVTDRQGLYDQNKRMMLSPKLKAFDVRQEPNFAKARERYGNTSFGESVLMARRLVEHGVTCVTVTIGSWDTHGNNKVAQKRLSDTVDPALGALLSDLKERGRLDRTLVIWMGEFGRTPKIDEDANGRGHWPHVFSVVLAGGGIKGGQVIGASTPDGTAVKDRRVTVPDLHCTIYKALGIDPRKRNRANSQRDAELVRGGEAVGELL
jgi:hypothetical protein